MKLEVFGRLQDDLKTIARRIYASAFDGALTVWVDDVGDIRGACGSMQPAVPSCWVAGTFDSAVSTTDIEDDLRSLQRERAKDWIVDPAAPPPRASRAQIRSRSTRQRNAANGTAAQKKCANPACHCRAMPGRAYCSDTCSYAVQGGHLDERCRCGHADCALSVPALGTSP